VTKTLGFVIGNFTVSCWLHDGLEKGFDRSSKDVMLAATIWVALWLGGVCK